MRTHLPRIAVAATLLVAVGILALVHQSYRGGFASGVTVTVETGRAGLVLDRGALVKRHGVQVGTVAAVHPSPTGAVVELSLFPGDAARIPADVGADIRATTVFGAKFVSLTDPVHPSGENLREGSVLRAANVTVETNSVFESLTSVLHAVDPAELNQTLGAAATALRGRGDDLGTALDDTGTILAQVNPRTDVLGEDLVATRSVAGTYTEAAPALLDSLGNLTVTARSVVDRAEDLDAVLLSVIGLTDTGIGVLEPNGPAIVGVLDLLRPTASVLEEYSPVLTCFFQGADQARLLAEPASGGNGSSMMLNSSLLLGSDPYEYPRNLPVVAATGGPRCGALPIVTAAESPAPYVVANTGANPFEAGNTSPVFVPGSILELLQGPVR